MRWVWLVAAVGLSACAPSLQNGNSVGGIVKEGLGPGKGGEALAVADAHCRKFGKVARISGQSALDSTLTFDCVTP
jgi:hypothetical protein